VRYLATYLNDHLGGSTGGLELARRITNQNARTELGAFMAGLTREIAEDRQTLREIMGELGVEASRPKIALGWATEKVGRLKPNGHVLQYSPLSRFIELEKLSLGIEGKRLMWVALAGAPAGERIGVERLTRLTERAERQRDGVERFRVDVGREVLRAG
jgi:hypothetical protein